jgi:hypothetical protein
MGVPKAVRHSQLLAQPLDERCRATTPVRSRTYPCRALFADGWEFHGCTHDRTDHSDHRCPCGHEWKAAQ